VKLLDIGSVVIFGLLALFSGFIVPGLGVSAIRLVIDISLFTVAAASLVARQPFTLQYAQGEVPPDVFASPSFLRANYLITLVWMVAFAVMGAADGAATFDPSVPLTGAVAAGLVTLACALTFTWRYPDYIARRLRDGR
jgi:tryptophan-rich sensory protein